MIVLDSEGQVIEIGCAVLRLIRFQRNVLLRIFCRNHALKYRLGQKRIAIWGDDLSETILGLAVRPKPFIGDGALSIRGKLAVLDVCGAGIALGDYVIGARCNGLPLASVVVFQQEGTAGKRAAICILLGNGNTSGPPLVFAGDGDGVIVLAHCPGAGAAFVQQIAMGCGGLRPGVGDTVDQIFKEW